MYFIAESSVVAGVSFQQSKNSCWGQITAVAMNACSQTSFFQINWPVLLTRLFKANRRDIIVNYFYLA